MEREQARKVNKRDEAAARRWQEWKNARLYELDSLIRLKERQLAEIQSKRAAATVDATSASGVA